MFSGVPACPPCTARELRGSWSWAGALRHLAGPLLPLAALGCGPQGATPVPQPPEAIAADAVSLPEVVDLSNRVTLLGAPGATEPGWIVRATNLDDTQPSVATSASPSGSFSLQLAAEDGDQLRLQVVNDAGRSPPTDLNYDDQQLQPVVRLECLQIEPGLALTVTSAPATLRFRNECGAPVTLANWRWRLGLPDFTVGSSSAVTMASEDSFEQTLAFVRSGSGQREDVLLVDVTGPGAAVVRYAVTVVATD